MADTVLTFEKVVRHHNDWVEHVCFNPEETLMATCCCEFLYLWDIPKITGSDQKRFCYGEKQEEMLTQKGAEEGDPSNQPETSFNIVSRLWHPESLWKSSFNATGTMLFTACGDGNVYVWSVSDVTGQHCGEDIKTPWKVLDVSPIVGTFGMAVSMVDDVIFTCDETRTLRVHAWRTGSVLATAHAHEDVCDDVAVSPTGRQVATCSKDWSVALWSWDPAGTTSGKSPDETLTTDMDPPENHVSKTTKSNEEGDEICLDTMPREGIPMVKVTDPECIMTIGGSSSGQETLSDHTGPDTETSDSGLVKHSVSIGIGRRQGSATDDNSEEEFRGDATRTSTHMASDKPTEIGILTNNSEDETVNDGSLSTSITDHAIYELPGSTSVTDIASEDWPNGSEIVSGSDTECRSDGLSTDHSPTGHFPVSAITTGGIAKVSTPVRDIDLVDSVRPSFPVSESDMARVSTPVLEIETDSITRVSANVSDSDSSNNTCSPIHVSDVDTDHTARVPTPVSDSNTGKSVRMTIPVSGIDTGNTDRVSTPVSDSDTYDSDSGHAGPTLSLQRRLLGHHHWVFSVSYSSDGELLASASADRSVGVWSVRSGVLLHQFTGHRNVVWSAIFVPSDLGHFGESNRGERHHHAMTSNLLVSCSSDFTVRVWDISRSKPIETHRQLGTGQVVRSPEGKVDTNKDKVTASRWDEIKVPVYDKHQASEADCNVDTAPTGEVKVTTHIAGDTYVTTTSPGQAPVTMVTRGPEQLPSPPSGRDQLFCCSHAPGRDLVAVASYHGEVHIARVRDILS